MNQSTIWDIESLLGDIDTLDSASDRLTEVCGSELLDVKGKLYVLCTKPTLYHPKR